MDVDCTLDRRAAERRHGGDGRLPAADSGSRSSRTGTPSPTITVRQTTSRPTRSRPSPADLFVANSGHDDAVPDRDGQPRRRAVPARRRAADAGAADSRTCSTRSTSSGSTRDSEAGNGCPPVVIEAQRAARRARVTVRADVSSQFLSGLLMAAPVRRRRATSSIEVDGPLVSEPYVEMTLAMMRQWGYEVDRAGPSDVSRSSRRTDIRPQRTTPSNPTPPPRRYFWAAAAITGGRVTVAGLTRKSLQGDVRVRRRARSRWAAASRSATRASPSTAARSAASTST